MAKMIVLLLIVAAALALAACGQQSPSPDAQLAAAPPRAAQDADRIGVAECDDYLDRYEACLASHAPEGARDALRTALQQTRTSWRKSMAHTSKEAMTAVCQRARAAARPSLVARGCPDF